MSQSISADHPNSPAPPVAGAPQGVEPTSRRELAKGGRRARIVEATYALLREVGIEDLSVKMIADQARVSPATVYNLFGTKAAVLQKVYDLDLAEFEQRMAKTVSRDSLERIFDSVAITAAHYRSDPRFYRSVVRMPNRDPADAQLIDAVTSRRAHFWSDQVRQAIKDGHLVAEADASRLGAAMSYLSSGAVGCWVTNLITIDRYEEDVACGVAALLMGFATESARPRLVARLSGASSPRAKSKGKTSA